MTRTKPLVVGITGGVGAGKSRVLSLLSDISDCRILYADEIAKELQRPGERCYNEIVGYMGKSLLDKEGRIDKTVLAKAIFDSDEVRDRINGIIHPAVKDHITGVIREEKKKGEREFLFIEAALLIECGYDRICDELWYIYASEASRRQRLKETRAYSDEKIDNIFKAQLGEEVFRKYCVEVIDNDSVFDKTEKDTTDIIDRKRREFKVGEC